MTDWKGRITTGVIAVPLIILVMHIRIAAIITFHVALFLANKEYQQMVLNILKMHSGESEHSYLDQMNRSKLALIPNHLFGIVAAITGKEEYMIISFMISVLLQFLLRIKDFIGYYNVLVQNKEFLSKDPTLDRKIILLTFLQTCGDILGMILYHLPFTFGMLMFMEEEYKEIIEKYSLFNL